jgi:hypothetical protein
MDSKYLAHIGTGQPVRNNEGGTMTTPTTEQNRAALRNVRMLIVLAILGALAAAIAGVVLWVAEPEAGSTAESALGFTAAIGGLGAAVASIAAAIYMQVKNLWKYAPATLRAAVAVFVIAGLVVTVSGWINQLFN